MKRIGFLNNMLKIPSIIEKITIRSPMHKDIFDLSNQVLKNN